MTPRTRYPLMMRLGHVLAAALLIAALSEGCKSSEGRGGPANANGKPIGYGASVSAGAGGQSLTTTSGGQGDCSDEGTCGTETHAISFEAPNLYFVLDASGSMLAEVPDKGGDTRYQVVRKAARTLVGKLGSLINVGVAIFPGPQKGCSGGDEVMPVTPGDPYSANDVGPTLQAFIDTTALTPAGGTPTAATLEALLPKLAELKGRTVVLLLTDGGPNCNTKASCGPDECMPVIEGECTPSQGCCDPSFAGGGPRLCVDREPTVKAVEAIHALGIDVYVIGVADLALYEGVLDEMAVAGGKPNATGTKYAEAKDLGKLGAIFSAIASNAIECEFVVQDPPEDKGFTNVHFDCTPLPLDPKNGWAWSSDTTITLYGDACAALKSGKVGQVKIVTGCPTEQPK